MFSQFRTADQYAWTMLQLHPKGSIFPRSMNTTLWKYMQGLSQELGRVDSQIMTVLNERFPGLANTLLDNWERDLGLPGEFTIPAAAADRRSLIDFIINGVYNYFQDYGIMDSFWIHLAADTHLGYEITSVQTYDRCKAGTAIMGETVGERWVNVMLFYVTLAGGQTPDLLEYYFNLIKPSHLNFKFSYS